MAHTVRSTLTDAQIPEIERCERRIGYAFQDKSLLAAALTHASGAQHRLASNERLEFLGDAILGAVVCELLYRQYPDYLEGDLTKIKSVVVSRQTCAKISEALGLQEFLILGKGMSSHPSVPPSLLADVFESLVAAIYLDGGDSAAREFIERYMEPEIELAAAGELGGNYKSLLQQLAQRETGTTPTYQLLDEKGPRPQQVLQDFRPDRPQPVSARLGPQQEGSRAARRPQRPGRSSTASPSPSPRTEFDLFTNFRSWHYFCATAAAQASFIAACIWFGVRSLMCVASDHLWP